MNAQNNSDKTVTEHNLRGSEKKTAGHLCEGKQAARGVSVRKKTKNSKLGTGVQILKKIKLFFNLCVSSLRRAMLILSVSFQLYRMSRRDREQDSRLRVISWFAQR